MASLSDDLATASSFGFAADRALRGFAGAFSLAVLASSAVSGAALSEASAFSAFLARARGARFTGAFLSAVPSADSPEASAGAADPALGLRGARRRLGFSSLASASASLLAAGCSPSVSLLVERRRPRGLASAFSSPPASLAPSEASSGLRLLLRRARVGFGSVGLVCTSASASLDWATASPAFSEPALSPPPDSERSPPRLRLPRRRRLRLGRSPPSSRASGSRDPDRGASASTISASSA